MKKLKYIADATDGGAAVDSFLDEDLSGLDTSIPLIKEGVYDLKVEKIEKVKTKDEKGEMLKFKLRTTAPAQVQGGGDPVPDGFVLFHQISITPTERYSKDAIKRNVAAFVQAIGAKTIFPLEQHEGKIVRAKVKVTGEREDKTTGETYAPKNEIKAFVKADES